MNFRIADTFTDSLAKLTGDEQKAVKTTAFDLQVDPSNPGMQLHRIEKAKDPNFWSVRVSRDIRAIVHRSESSLLLCYVAHHDDAYRWAERRKLERHPTTGAAQIVEVRELVKQITVPVYIQEERKKEPVRVFTQLAERLQNQKSRPFEFAVVDESQDLTVAQLRFLAALGGNHPEKLFFAGDLGQRIFQHPFSWKSLGVDVRGRSHTLRVCYRTSHQIRKQADRLLPPQLQDVDENTEDRRGTISVFNGPPPKIYEADSQEDECEAVAEWLRGLIETGVRGHEIGIFVRDEDQIPRGMAVADALQLKSQSIMDAASPQADTITVAPMHSAKGLEFRAVAVMACDDEVIPSQSRIDELGDGADLEEVYNTERNLLYVACTRARDHLLVTGVDPASEFLEDLRAIESHRDIL